MKATLTRLGGITMVSMTTLAGLASPTTLDSKGFSAAVTGAAHSTISGAASFGRVAGGPTAPDVLSLNLGTESSPGAIQFIRPGRSRLAIGSYPISDLAPGSDQFRALVMLGSSERPEGVFRAESGVLTITSMSDQTLTGRFELEAIGFTADRPEREDQRVHVSGWFTAAQ